MRQQHNKWFDWLDSRLDADDMNAIGAALSALIAECDNGTLLRAENALQGEDIIIDDADSPREKGDDDGQEYGDPRDALDERLED